MESHSKRWFTSLATNRSRHSQLTLTVSQDVNSDFPFKAAYSMR